MVLNAPEDQTLLSCGRTKWLDSFSSSLVVVAEDPATPDSCLGGAEKQGKNKKRVVGSVIPSKTLFLSLTGSLEPAYLPYNHPLLQGVPEEKS